MRLTFLFLIIMLIGLLGSGCNPSHQQENDQESMRKVDIPDKGSVNQYLGEEFSLPLEIQEELFHSVADWKDDKTIFYILNDADGSKIHTYNLFTGESSLFFTSEAPIVQMEANENHSLFFIHTSPTSYEANLIVINNEAKVQFETTIESSELQYTWNQQNHDQLFVSSFNEDWTYETYLIDASEQSIFKNPIDIPFIQWVNSNQVTYLKWDQDAPSLTAPLYMYDLKTNTETLITEGVVANTNYVDVMSTIELVDDEGTASVRFYDMDEQNNIAEMPTRLVALYSDWSIPYHDMDHKNKVFYILEVNQEKTAFSLMSFSLQSGEKQTLIENVENLPLKISPNGEYALYGARYEQIIQLKNQTIKELIKFK